MLYLLADLHLGQSLRSSIEFEEDCYIALHNAKEQIIADNEDNKVVILAGDIFGQRKVDGRSLKYFNEFVRDLYVSKIPVLFIQGNHDFNNQPIPDVFGCTHMQYSKEDPATVYTYGGDKTIVGLDYVGTEDLKAQLEVIPECDLLILHAGFKHLLGFAGAFNLTWDDIPARVKNVVVGHIHTTSIKNFAGRHCISPGGLHPCALSEGNSHGYVKMDFQNTPKFVEIETRRILRFYVENVVDLRETKATLDSYSKVEYQQKPVVNINYAPDFKNDIQEIQKALPGFIYLSDVKSKLSDEGCSDTNEILSQLSLDKALEKAVSKKKEPEVYMFLQRLILNDEPDKFIEQTIQEALKPTEETVALF